MNLSTKAKSGFYADIQQTELGQMCGTKKLFRDRYEVGRILGRGGFGVTFLAQDAVLPGKPLCVIKQLCPRVVNPQTWQRSCKRFEQEAKILSKLGSHSQIPMLLDYFEASGQFYLVQEYVRGATIAKEIKRSGPKDEGAVKQFLQELLPILRYVHSQRVIHRDIKPHNLIRCADDGRLVLIDFGAVKDQFRLEEGNTKTATTNFVGTMGFAPPEQFSLRPVYASDIYAIGATCLYMLTGKAPLEFDHDPNTGEICWQNQVDISDNFAQVLSKMLKISVNERYKSADEVIWGLGLERYLNTLTHCLTTQPLGTRPQGERTEYTSPVSRTAQAIRDWQEKLNARRTSNPKQWSLSSHSIG